MEFTSLKYPTGYKNVNNEGINDWEPSYGIVLLGMFNNTHPIIKGVSELCTKGGVWVNRTAELWM